MISTSFLSKNLAQARCLCGRIRWSSSRGNQKPSRDNGVQNQEINSCTKDNASRYPTHYNKTGENELSLTISRNQQQKHHHHHHHSPSSISLSKQKRWYTSETTTTEESLIANANYDDDDNNDNNRKDAGMLDIPGAQTGGKKLALVYTCTLCDTRSVKQFSERAYRHGVVIVQCPGCNNRHLIADNLGFFQDKKDGGWNIENALKNIGDNVKVINDDNVLELSVEDIYGQDSIKAATEAARNSTSGKQQ